MSTEDYTSITLQGTGQINLMGDGEDNELTGDDNDNIITGGGGADTLTGGAGADAASLQTAAIAASFTLSGLFGGTTGYSNTAAFVAALTGITAGVANSGTYVAFAINTAHTMLWVAKASETGGAGTDIDAASIVMEIGVDNVVAGDIIIA